MSLVIRGITKVYKSQRGGGSNRNRDTNDRDTNDRVAVENFNLDVRDGELIAIMGPSGCGKSTLLRVISGLESPTSGTIHRHGEDITHLPPHQRGVAMVFQDHGLYPHMSVEQNMGFGLQLANRRPLFSKRPLFSGRRGGKAEADRVKSDVFRMAHTVGVDKLMLRYPKEISGGERQRVALARALVHTPQIALFDEPLSNLDMGLRHDLRMEISEMHRNNTNNSGGVTIYVTHDQSEGLALGHRVVIMNNGSIQQVGTPEEVYNNPTNTFVATFLGSPPMNIIHCTTVTADGTTMVSSVSHKGINYDNHPHSEQYQLGLRLFVASDMLNTQSQQYPNEIYMGIRGENITLVDLVQCRPKYGSGSMGVHPEHKGEANIVVDDGSLVISMVATLSSVQFQGGTAMLYVDINSQNHVAITVHPATELYQRVKSIVENPINHTYTSGFCKGSMWQLTCVATRASVFSYPSGDAVDVIDVTPWEQRY